MSSVVKNKQFRIYALFLIKVLSLFAIVAFAVVLLKQINPTSETLSTFVDTHILRYGIWGMFAFAILSSVLSSFFVPRQLLAFVGGYAYGVWLGTLIVTVGVTLGCFLTFIYSRLMIQKIVQRKLGLRIAWMEHLFSKNPFGMALSIRVIPVGSNVLLNMLAGVTKISTIPFCLGSAIGYIPQNLVSALLGTGMRADPLVRVSIAALLYGIGIIVGLWLFKKYKPDNSMGLKTIIRSILKPHTVSQDNTPKDIIPPSDTTQKTPKQTI